MSLKNKAIVIVVSVMAIFLVSLLVLKPFFMSIPSTTFDNTPKPIAPDYSQLTSWAAHPNKKSGASSVPKHSGFKDQQKTAVADVFFVNPTSAFPGKFWNASIDNLLANFIVDTAQIPQMATPFNGVAKIYAPRYRQVRMPVWKKADKNTQRQATDVAYQDVRDAFQYYLDHWNKGRPFYIVTDSQGSTLAKMLLKNVPNASLVKNNMVAAYLVGEAVGVNELDFPICDHKNQTGCYVTWNSVAEGGAAGKQRLKEKGYQQISCVNPISWRSDLKKVSKNENLGSLPMTYFGTSSLKPLDEKITGARCGENGILWIDKPPSKGYSLAVFEGGNYHTYDINLFYANIRENAKERLEAFLQANNAGLE